VEVTVSRAATDEDRSRLLITGANGFIGSRLAALALERGHDVRTVTRSEWSGRPAVPSEDRFLGSLPNRIPTEALQGVEVVAHCAGTGDPGERLAQAVNVEGTVRLAEAARSAGVGAFIFLSSQSAKRDATSAYGRTKFEAEERLRAMDGISVVIIRPGLVTGPGARGLFKRLTVTVERWPVIPLLGGGKALVQPIHVDDLCEAILRCEPLADALDGRVLCLGDPEGISLAELVQQIAVARLGRRRATIPIPIGPIELVVRLAEKLRLPLPMNSNNLKGLRTVERMETADDMALLGVPTRPIADSLGLDRTAETAPAQAGAGPVGILLVGAGRVGLVHAVTLTRLRGAVLAGLVDRSRLAIVFLQRIGVRTSGFPSVGAALSATHAEAAVVATPPATHLELARACVERGLAVMIEKPLAVREEQLADFESLGKEFPEARIQIGYLMPQIPQVAAMLERLKGGELGEVVGFEAFTLLSFVEGPLEGRWETNPDVSGGGAFINAGGHVLSIIQTALGDPNHIEARSVRIHSENVEDSIVVDLDYGAFTGRHYCSWSIGGFPRQENLLRVRTDRGELVISGGLATFQADDGTLEVLHGLDTDVGFNLAPDYVGAGFTTELGRLRDAARGGPLAPMDVARASGIERVLFGAYRVAKDAQAFEERAEAIVPVTTEPRLRGIPMPEGAGPGRLLDLKGIDAAMVAEYLSRPGGTRPWDGFVVYPQQVRVVPSALLEGGRVSVTVPDFPTQGRLISLGRQREVVKGLGVRGVIAAVLAAGPQGLRDRSPTFWVGALGLLGGAMSAIPRGFDGGVLLHPALVDLALALRRHDMLERLLSICRKAQPEAQIGFHTNLAAEAADALPLLDVEVGVLSILASPNSDGDGVVAELRAVSPGPVRIVAEVGPAPFVIQRTAAAQPHAWAHGADAVLIGAVADEHLRARIGKDRARAWSEAFPGLAVPEGIPW
jgi:nucleoside-diphosphate-sugar epimerase/predicted dehydrogenase